jgi:acyl-coenzyme A thioesterase PaaI-like protein
LAASAVRSKSPRLVRERGRLWRVDITDESGRLVAHGEVRLQNVSGK